jgi:AcrR family transcriptional regulator
MVMANLSQDDVCYLVRRAADFPGLVPASSISGHRGRFVRNRIGERRARAHLGVMAKPDRRTERTRAALLSAFIGVLLAEGYEALTVEQVCERANVGRSTFYMHYTSKEGILRESMTRPASVLAVLVGNVLPPEALVGQLVHFHDQRRRNHIFFAGQVRTIWIRVLAELIEPRLTRLVRAHRARPILPLNFAALQIAEVQLALIANWLTANPGAKPELVGEALVATTHATVAALLRAPAEAPLLIPNEKLAFRIVEP